MTNDALIGLEGPPFDVWIESGKVREFARGTYSHHSSYLETMHPTIPPTYLATAGYVWGYTLERPGDTDLRRANLELAMTLHAEDEFVFHGAPPRAGGKLVARTKIEDIYEKQGARSGRLTFWQMLTEFRDEAGLVVALDRTTSVAPERAPAAEAVDVTPLAERPFFERDEGADLLRAIPASGGGTWPKGAAPARSPSRRSRSPRSSATRGRPSTTTPCITTRTTPGTAATRPTSRSACSTSAPSRPMRPIGWVPRTCGGSRRASWASSGPATA